MNVKRVVIILEKYPKWRKYTKRSEKMTDTWRE